MTTPTFTRRDGRIWLELTAPAISIGLTDDDAAQLLLTLSALVGGDKPVESHPEVPHLEGWTRVVDALPGTRKSVRLRFKDGSIDPATFCNVNWNHPANDGVTHWRYA